MRVPHLFLALALVPAVTLSCAARPPAHPEPGLEARASASPPVVVITDWEPDDVIALHLLAGGVEARRIVLVGTTVLHAGRKALLARRLFDQLGLERVPVVAGSGGSPASYPDFPSTRAARTWDAEAAGRVPPDLSSPAAAAPRSSSALADRLVQVLQERDGVEIVLLAPPTDLVAALRRLPARRRAVHRIHVMGGWSDGPANGQGERPRWTTYNWTMAPADSRELMRLTDVPVTLYSSHVLKEAFEGGSVNARRAPAIFAALDRAADRLASVAEWAKASRRWDEHVMVTIPALAGVIGPHAGRQFTPADPAVVLGLLAPEIVTASHGVRVDIDPAATHEGRGFRVAVTPDPRSHVRAVDSLDPVLFERAFVAALAGVRRPSFKSRIPNRDF